MVYTCTNRYLAETSVMAKLVTGVRNMPGVYAKTYIPTLVCKVGDTAVWAKVPKTLALNKGKGKDAEKDVRIWEATAEERKAYTTFCLCPHEPSGRYMEDTFLSAATVASLLAITPKDAERLHKIATDVQVAKLAQGQSRITTTADTNEMVDLDDLFGN